MTKKVIEYLHGIFRFCQADKNKKGKNKWKMKMCDEWVNGNMNIDYLLHISCIIFCLNQSNKKRK